jgi:hypothetical protein
VGSYSAVGDHAHTFPFATAATKKRKSMKGIIYIIATLWAAIAAVYFAYVQHDHKTALMCCGLALLFKDNIDRE